MTSDSYRTCPDHSYPRVRQCGRCATSAEPKGAPPNPLLHGTEAPKIFCLSLWRRRRLRCARNRPPPPWVLVIGSSTGGPQALTEICGRLGSGDRPGAGSHYPAYAADLHHHSCGTSGTRATGRPAREAEDSEPIRAGQIYVAPGHRHLRVVRSGGQPVAILDDAAACISASRRWTFWFSSAADVWGAWVQGLVLTGMGTDGTSGAHDIVASGGSIMAQDEATSIVWGMPGSVAQAGVCSSVLP